MSLRAFAKACAVPWAILPATLQTILEISTREHIPDFEAVAAKRARRLDGADAVTVREGGVAVIPVTGPIFRYADFFTEISGGTTVSSLSRDFHEALSNPNVQSIILNIDSPGGEVAGINEFAQMVFDSRGKKPIVAYGDGLVASAAYWIASAAEEIVTDATAMVGSIGVVAAVSNPNVRQAKEIEFVSSQSPKKRPDPNTESGKAQLQNLVDGLAEVFVSTVARNRGASVETVLAEFGQGDVLVGQKAVDAGLADRLGSFEELVAEMASGQYPKRKRRKMAAEAEEDAMSDRFDKLKARVMAAISSEEPAPVVEEEKPEETEETKPEPEAKTDPKITALEQENARLRQDAQQRQVDAARSDAEAFADAQIKANRALPTERDAIIADHLQAAADDGKMPISPVSRVQRFEASFTSRPSHRLTQELVVGAEHRVLKADENNQTEMSEERRHELLNASSVGRAALKAVK